MAANRALLNDDLVLVRSLLVSAAASLVLTVGVGVAGAEKIVVADVTADAELEAIAGGLTLVLRSFVVSQPLVDRASLATAVAGVGASSERALAVAPDRVPSALNVLSADRWLSAELIRVGVAFELRLVAFDREGRQTGARALRAPLGDYDALAKEAVAVGNQLVGAVPLKQPSAGSYARVAAAGAALARLAEGDTKASAKLLAASSVRLGGELGAARGIAAAIIADKRVPLDLRMNAALVAGDRQAALKMIEKAPNDPRAIALLARVKISESDYAAAKNVLTKAKKSKHRFVVLARAALAAELGRVDELAGHLGELIEGRSYIPALVLASQQRPKALGTKTEAALLRAAKRIARSRPKLASQIGTRALRGGARDESVFLLVDPLSIGIVDLKELKSALEELKNEKLKALIGAEIAVREEQLDLARELARLAVNLDPDNARAKLIAAHLKEAEELAVPEQGSGEPTPKARAAKQRLSDPKRAAELRDLAQDLGPMLAAFPTLVSEMGKVVLVPRTGSRELPFWPTRVHPDRLRDGLEAALAEPPYELLSAIEVGEVEEKPTRLDLAKIAKDYDAGGVLVYGVRTDGFDATVSLLLFSRRSVKSEVFSDTLRDADEHGVVSWNPLFVTVALVFSGALLLWLIWLVVRGSGSIRLQVKGDPASEHQSFSVLLSRRNRCPVVTDPKLHLANVTAEATEGRFGAHNIGAVVEFERVPPGSWFVHIYGTFEKAGETRCLPATTAGTKVRRSRTSVVDIDLIPEETEFHILVSGEGGPAAGALIWLSTEPAKKYAADVSGKAVVFAPPGDHTLHVSHRALEVTRKVTAFGSKVSTVHLNLVRERRLKEVSQGLEFEGGEGSSEHVWPVGATAFPMASEDTPTPAPLPLTPKETVRQARVSRMERSPGFAAIAPARKSERAPWASSITPLTKSSIAPSRSRL